MSSAPGSTALTSFAPRGRGTHERVSAIVELDLDLAAGDSRAVRRQAELGSVEHGSRAHVEAPVVGQGHVNTPSAYAPASSGQPMWAQALRTAWIASAVPDQQHADTLRVDRQRVVCAQRALVARRDPFWCRHRLTCCAPRRAGGSRRPPRAYHPADGSKSCLALTERELHGRIPGRRMVYVLRIRRLLPRARRALRRQRAELLERQLKEEPMSAWSARRCGPPRRPS